MLAMAPLLPAGLLGGSEDIVGGVSGSEEGAWTSSTVSYYGGKGHTMVGSGAGILWHYFINKYIVLMLGREREERVALMNP